jgi:PhzF family phenazine biosynthesis protein
MTLLRLAAFSDGNSGGNPAGVYIDSALPSTFDMQRIAAEIGYSETVFAIPQGTGWRVRYFSPETEVPFCGHATIALGAALARQEGDGIYQLFLNEAKITVEGNHADGVISAALQSPPTHSKSISDSLTTEILNLFGYKQEDLNPELPPAFANGGANHIVIGLSSRKALSAMAYDLEAGRALMNREGLITILFAVAETAQLFHTRNPFASGGVYEDPATGAATAAFCGYLRDINWPHLGSIDIVQGEDMAWRSRIKAEFDSTPGSSIRVSGTARMID